MSPGRTVAYSRASRRMSASARPVFDATRVGASRRGVRAAPASRRCARSARPRRASPPPPGYGRSPRPGNRRCRGSVAGASRPSPRIWCGAIDDHDPAAAPLGLAQEGQEVRRRADWVVAPQDNQAAVDHVGIGRAPAPAERDRDGLFGRGAADAPLQLAGPQTIEQAHRGHGILHQSQRAAVAVGQDGLRARLRDDRLPAADDLRDGLVPADAPPLAGALGARAAEGIKQASG